VTFCSAKTTTGKTPTGHDFVNDSGENCRAATENLWSETDFVVGFSILRSFASGCDVSVHLALRGTSVNETSSNKNDLYNVSEENIASL